MNTSEVSSRYVLGVSPGLHDASAALLRDGELVAMVEQERLSRRRHAFFEPPHDAIAACLAQEGIDLGAVAEIAVGWDMPALLELEGVDSFDVAEFRTWLLGRNETGCRVPSIRFVDHHMAHAASAFYTSGFAEAAILVVDGRGESTATTVAVGGLGGIDVIKTWGAHLSLGLLYAWAAEWAGLTPRGVGKLMGLAAYGRPCQSVPLAVSQDGYTIANAQPLDLDSPLTPHLMQLRSRHQYNFQRQNYPFSQGDPAEVMAHANFAASIQCALEDVLLNLAAIARRETGKSKLVMAGGVASNCTANGELIRSNIFDEVWIPPFPFDAGVSLGAALVADGKDRRQPKTRSRLPHAFWAPASNSSNVDLSQLSECEMTRHTDARLPDIVAQHLEEGKLIGWCQGRAEVGQRALGARSILCDPRRRQALVRLNRIKGRERWRPLAPAVLAEHTGALFDGSLPTAADFMLAAWPVRERAWARVPASVHIDGSARPQVVWPAQSRFHDVIRAFHERTGVPAVVNTSFNLAGEPIVLSRHDAVNTFLHSDLDVLVLDDLVAIKPTASPQTPDKRQPDPAPGYPLPWSERWRKSHAGHASSN